MADSSDDRSTEPGRADHERPRPDSIEVQLRTGLFVTQWVGAVMVLFGIGYLVVRGDQAESRATLVATVLAFLWLPGCVLFFTARSAARRVREQAVSGKLWSELTGGFTLLAALPFVSAGIGMVGIILGLYTLTAAVLFKRPDVRRGTVA